MLTFVYMSECLILTLGRGSPAKHVSNSTNYRLDQRAIAPCESWREVLAYYAKTPAIWAGQFLHNSYGIFRVWDLVHFRPMQAGLIGADHPFVTGIHEPSGELIWDQNILYQSPRWDAWPESAGRPPEDDVTLVRKLGRFMAGFVEKSTVVPEIEWGRFRRLPHGINYLHGGVHYNGGYLVFNDFADAMRHFHDKRFVAEVKRFARTERREVLLAFRQREYEYLDYAYFAGFLRTILPYFSNSNGPKDRVLWGNPSPYAVVNVITGNWMRDVYLLKTEVGRREAVRPPIERRRYFQLAEYGGAHRLPRLPEKLLAIYTYYRLRMRGAKGNSFFVDRRKLMADKLRHKAEVGTRDRPIADIFASEILKDQNRLPSRVATESARVMSS